MAKFTLRFSGYNPGSLSSIVSQLVNYLEQHDINQYDLKCAEIEVSGVSVSSGRKTTVSCAVKPGYTPIGACFVSESSSDFTVGNPTILNDTVYVSLANNNSASKTATGTVKVFFFESQYIVEEND